jgi:hypothetical protein
VIELLFTISVFANVFLVWYIVQLLRRFLAFQEELDEFAIKLEEYEGHVEIINNLERFYGDSTLANLLRHSKSMVEECKQFQSILLEQEEEEDAEEA